MIKALAFVAAAGMVILCVVQVATLARESSGVGEYVLAAVWAIGSVALFRLGLSRKRNGS
jgi:FtsH-binding integral membrane protein